MWAFGGADSQGHCEELCACDTGASLKMMTTTKGTVERMSKMPIVVPYAASSRSVPSARCTSGHEGVCEPGSQHAKAVARRLLPASLTIGKACFARRQP